MSGAGLFERLALSQISSDLEPSIDDRHTAIDRVTALGFAPIMGSLLIRIKGGNDGASYRQAHELMMWRLSIRDTKRNWSNPNRTSRVVSEALRFYVFDMCKTCEGRGQLAHSYTGPADDEAGAICPSCSGTTKAPRDVSGRARSIFQRGDIPARLEVMLDEADALIGRCERIATGVSRWKLYGSEGVSTIYSG